MRMRAMPVDAARHNPRICDLVGRWLEENPQLTRIALYHPMPDEPDLLPLLDRLPGRIWHFPRIEEDSLTFHAVSSLADDLTPGVFGIPEPRPSLPPADPKAIQAFLCPGLAFQKSTGLRLGRGKGYYDRQLAQASDDAAFIGITFPERLVEDTFAEPHDIRMHLVFS
jgi:5-formyltetrahydrofolate cyclo-ligase